MIEEPTTLGIDVGGTTIKAELVGGDDRVLARWTEETPHPDPHGAEVVSIVGDLLTLARGIERPAAVGVVVPGIVDEVQGVCVRSDNLGWRDLPIRRRLQDRIPLPLAVGHDVRAGALAEALTEKGAAREELMMFLPLGTGMSAAFARRGRVIRFGDHTGEVGQVRLDDSGRTVEDTISAGGLARRIGTESGQEAVALVRSGDPAAVSAWNELIDCLAMTIAWTSTAVGAARVVLGGGLVLSEDVLLHPLRISLAARLPPSLVPTVRIAAYGARSAVHGAVILGRRMLHSA